MHYPGCWKLIIRKIPSIPATCFLSIACGIEYLTHTSEHQAGCDTSLCMQLAPLQVSLMPDVSLNMTQEIMLVFAISSFFVFFIFLVTFQDQVLNKRKRIICGQR